MCWVTLHNARQNITPATLRRINAPYSRTATTSCIYTRPPCTKLNKNSLPSRILSLPIPRCILVTIP
jgi:hypothetical protein